MRAIVTLVIVVAITACGASAPDGAFGVVLGESTEEATKTLKLSCVGRWSESVGGPPWKACVGDPTEIWGHQGTYSIVASDQTVAAIEVLWPCDSSAREDLRAHTRREFGLKPNQSDDDPYKVWSAGQTLRFDYRSAHRSCRLVVADRVYGERYRNARLGEDLHDIANKFVPH